MMNIFVKVGGLFMAIVYFTDRFIYKMDDSLYILLLLIAITLFVMGMIKKRKIRKGICDEI